MKDTHRRYWVELALVGVAAVWGGTFLMVKDAVDRYPLYSFLTWRFAIAAVAFAVLFPGSLRRFRPGTLTVGILAGLCLTSGYVFQTWGLMDTSASAAAFITGMFVVITPVLQTVFLRRLPSGTAIIAVIVAVVGLWLLTGGSEGGWGVGETRVLLCALSYSLHMIVLGWRGREHDSRSLTLVQLATVAIVCALVALASEGASVPQDGSVWFALAFTGLLGSAAAFGIQTYAQRHLEPTRTALILITEPAFGGLFGVLLGGDRLGPSGFAGAGLILGGMAMAEARAALRTRKGEDVILEPTLEGIPVQVVDSSGMAEDAPGEERNQG